MSKRDDILQQLYHPNEEVRQKVIQDLNLLPREENLILLSEGLGDPSWRVRRTAIEVIANYPNFKSAVAVLINALYDHENVGRRTSAIEALVRMGEKVLEELGLAYQTNDREVRKFIMDIFGEIRSKKALPFVLKGIEDPDENVRLAAVEALGKIRGEEAEEKLLELVNSSNDLVIRFSALHILGKSDRGLPPETIKRLLKERIFRRAVFEVLGQSPSPQAVQFLMEGITDSSKTARQSAIHSLAKIYENDSSGELQMQIEQSLNKALNSQNLHLIMEFTTSDHSRLRRDALLLLSLLNNSEVLYYLFSLVRDDSITDELASIFLRLSRTRPHWFKNQLERTPSEIKEIVKKLLQEEEDGWILLEEKKLVLSDDEFNQIRDRLSVSYGIYFDQEMKYLVERKITQRMSKRKLKKISDYLLLLENPFSGQEELNNLAQLLVNNETYFFREDFQLKTFDEEIMPELIRSARKENRNLIKIWSAGCSSGEEPYTIAMLIAERKDLNGLKVEIYGSDLHQEMIARAKQGLYGPSSFRVINDYYFKKYFSPIGNKYQIDEKIKKMVQFDNLNLLSFNYPPYLKNLDLIFCRNVLIYFSLEAKRVLVERFYQALRWGGFLLLGHSESLLNLSTAFRLRHFKHDLVHQKPSLEE